MKTQNEIRVEFERLEEITNKLEYLFFEDGFYFRKYDDADTDEYFVNGAWYAYQEQQKEIDELQKRIDEALRHVVDHGGYDDLTHVINILKGKNND